MVKRAYALYKKYTLEQLVEQMRVVLSDPASKLPKPSFQIYTVSARRKMDALAWAITWHQADRRRNAQMDKGPAQEPGTN